MAKKPRKKFKLVQRESTLDLEDHASNLEGVSFPGMY